MGDKFYDRVENALDAEVYTSAEFKAVMNRFADIVKKANAVASCQSLDHIQSQQQWLNHKAAFIPNGLWLRKEMADLDSIPDGFEMRYAPSALNVKQQIIVASSQACAIAKDAENGKLIENKDGSLDLRTSASATKSCGPDGKPNTDDDGLPSSLEELLILSGELKNKTGAGPFTVTGANLYYTNYLVEGLWASLAGSEELKAVYGFNGSVDVVIGYTDENLFKGIDYIKKPIVTKTTITNKNGNLALKSAARYYATAFIEILHKEGFFSDISSSVSHTGAQKNFINGGVRTNSVRAFLVDGSYWYNESVDQGNFKDYTTMTGKTARGVRFMSLPVTATGSVTPSETATKPSLIDNGIAYAYINARYSDKTDIVKACKTFLKFLYSDAELKEFTALTGVTRPLTYSLTEAQYNKLPEYQQKVYDLSRNSDILYFGSENPIFKNNQQTFKIHFSSQIMNPTINNTQYKSYYEAIKGGSTSKKVFEATVITDEVWNNIVNK